jgi:hypothetical protein
MCTNVIAHTGGAHIPHGLRVRELLLLILFTMFCLTNIVFLSDLMFPIL